MNNSIKICGVISRGPSFSHLIAGRVFYRGEIVCRRLSGVTDLLPFVCTEAQAEGIACGDRVCIEGAVKTRDVKSANGCSLDVFLSVLNVALVDSVSDLNEVILDGVVCSVCRLREVGARKLRTIMVANSCGYRTSYIPCILWANDADLPLAVGDSVSIVGRLQSRDYIKNDGCCGSTRELSVVHIN